MVNDIKSNMNKNFSVRKINLNDERSLLTTKRSEFSDTKEERKRSQSLYIISYSASLNHIP
jgi:hypothetical protein